ncbi:MAG: TonB-dependent receptor, partial [Calditrichota bacterium]
LFGTAGKGFRNPTIRELYLFPAPNPDLQPEQTTTTQLGVRYEPATTFSADMTLYRTRGNNMIEMLGQWPNLQLQNSGEVFFQGTEVALKFIPVSGLHLGLNYSAFRSDTPVSSQPADHLEMTLTHHGSWYTLRYKFRHVKGVQNIINKEYITLPAYSVTTVGLDLVPFEFGHLFLTVENLWNTDYQTMFGYPMPGRTVEGGMTFDL